MNHYTLTCSGATQRLSDALPSGQQTPGGTADVAYLRLDLQPDGANANPIFLGGPQTPLDATNHGVRLPAGSSGAPPPPYSFEGNGTVKLSHLYAKGTAGEKLHIFGLPG